VNKRLIREEAEKIENGSIRSMLLGSIRKGHWFGETFIPQAIWNLAKYIVELEERVKELSGIASSSGTSLQDGE